MFTVIMTISNKFEQFECTKTFFRPIIFLRCHDKPYFFSYEINKKKVVIGI